MPKRKLKCRKDILKTEVTSEALSDSEINIKPRVHDGKRQNLARGPPLSLAISILEPKGGAPTPMPVRNWTGQNTWKKQQD